MRCVMLGCVATSVASADGFRADRLMLTWQNDPTTTMTVQWISNVKELPPVAGGAVEAPVPRIPFVAKRGGGGSQAEEDGRLLALPYLANETHQRFPADEFDADVRVGWMADGLLVKVRVTDPLAGENPAPQFIWAGDSVELFVSDGVGSKTCYQVVLAPGRAPGTEARHTFFPKAGGPAAETLTVKQAGEATEGGYVIEALLPWSNLPGFKAAEGATVTLQVYVNSQAGGGFSARRLTLHPALNTSSDPSETMVFALGAKASAPLRGRATVDLDDPAHPRLRVHGTTDLVGKTMTLRSGSHALGEGVLVAQGRDAFAEIALPDAPEGEAWRVVEAVVDGEVIAWANLTEWGYGTPPAPTVMRYWPREGGETEALQATTQVARVEKWRGHYRQRVELTGLTPGTDYRFRADGEEKDFGFRTMPSRLTRPVRFAEGGDTRHDTRWMKTTNAVAMRYDPDFVVWGGDFAYANGLEQNTPLWEEWFEANNTALIGADNRVVPIVGAVGNHEVVGSYYTSHAGYRQTDEWRRRIAPYFYQFFAFPGQPGYGALDFGDYLSILALDTGHTNPVAGAQTEWLEAALAKRRGRPHVFPVYHVPAFPSQRSYDSQPSVQVRENWVPLFEKHGVEVAFEHHDHTYKRTHPLRAGKVAEDGIVYFGDGAWGVREREGASKEAWYIKRFSSRRHAIIVTLDEDGRRFVVVNDAGEVIDEYPEQATR